MSCEHDVDAEYLYPSDARIHEITGRDGGIRLAVVVPCPECGQALKLTATVEEVEEVSLEVPFDDAEDSYD